MDNIAAVKESRQAQTPLLLLECTFGNGTVRRWATQALVYGGVSYEARVLRHNALDIQSMSETGIDQIPRLSIVLANADAAMSQLDQSASFKGARLLARFVFADIETGQTSLDSLVIFSGICNAPDEVTDTELRLSALNRMNMQRVALPPVKIQRRCPWSFPSTEQERAAGASDPNSVFWACGYAPDQPRTNGRVQPGGAPFTSCDYTRAHCIARGMFNHDAWSQLTVSAAAGTTTIETDRSPGEVGDAIDIGGAPDPRSNFSSQEEVRITGKFGSGPVVITIDRSLRASHPAGGVVGHPTRRFGGIEYVPETIDVRPYGSPFYIKSPVQGVAARYNDQVPVVYGTAWIEPVVTVLRNDGNLTRMEAVLTLGHASRVQRVVVNDYEASTASAALAGQSASGWHVMVADGSRWGGYDLNFTDGGGNPLGDPYGSMAYLSIVVPNKISDGRSVPRVQVLLDGRMIETFSANGVSLGFSFTNNTAWVLLDLLKLSRWPLSQLDLASFAEAAAFCGELIAATDNDGNPVTTPRFQCNLALRQRRSAADAILAVRNNARLFFTYSAAGRLQLRVENTIALQQPALPYGSNATEPIAGGWPAYVYADTNGTIVRHSGGASSLRVFHRPITDTPNRFAFEFQDAFNEYVQDAFAIDDVEDQTATGQEISQTLAVEGIPSYDQAARVAKFQLDKSVRGNTFVEFETSVKAAGQQVGQIIALSYAREGWNNQLFRILKLSPQSNFRTVRITAQIHDDAWYADTNGSLNPVGGRARHRGHSDRPPNPLLGAVPRPDGDMDWALSEHVSSDADGTGSVEIEAGFALPVSAFSLATGAPNADLQATIETAAGALEGGRTLYYRVTAHDADGACSAPSFAMRADLPAGTNTNAATLTGLRFDSAAVSFDVYRGTSPVKMFRIANGIAIRSAFLDAGLTAEGVALPDAYFDHAAFYYKRRETDEVLATAFDAGTIGSSSLDLAPNKYTGHLVRLTAGPGAGQVRRIVAHEAQLIHVSPRWSVEPAGATNFHIEEPDWKFASAASSSPATFRVPNEKGKTLLIEGRAADESNWESPETLACVTPWTIGGVGPGVSDVAPPPAPVFGIGVPRDGTLVLAPLGFSAPENTAGVTSATCELYYADELSPVRTAVQGGVAIETEIIPVASSAGFAPDDYVALDREIIRIREINGAQWMAERGALETTPSAHAHGALAARLVSHVSVYAFEPGFFSQPESTHWSVSIALPCARVATVRVRAANAFGNGAPSLSNCLVFDADPGLAGALPGLRTNEGGEPYQMGIAGQVRAMDGRASVAVLRKTSVRDIWAALRTPSAVPISVDVRRGGNAIGSIGIVAGDCLSNAVSGAAFDPLEKDDALSFAVVAAAAGGWDLTIFVRV